MSAPSLGLVANWTGQLTAASELLQSLSILPMTDSEMELALTYLQVISRQAHALKSLIQESLEG